MKKIKYIILASLFVLPLASCVQDEPDVFDVPAAQRIAERLRDIKNTLVSSEDGWLLELYTDTTLYGGYTILLKFNEDLTVVTNAETRVREMAGVTDPLPENQLRTTTYAVKSAAAPTISFDTYNDYVHNFSDPGDDGVGFNGDFEFKVMELGNDLIKLKGDRKGTTMFLRRLPQQTDWATYLSGVDAISSAKSTWDKNVITDGSDHESMAELGMYGRLFTLFNESTGSYTISKIPYAFTNNGIRLKNPVRLMGKQVQNFIYSTDTQKFVCIDPGATDVTLEQGVLNPNDQICYGKNWWFKNNEMAAGLQPAWSAAKTSATTIDLSASLISNIRVERVLIGSGRGSGASSIALGEDISGNHGVQCTLVGTQIIFSLRFAVLWDYDFVPVKGTTDRINLYLKGVNNDLAGLLIGEAQDLDNIPGIVARAPGREYIVTANADTDPTQLTFKAADDPDNHYFTVFSTAQTP